MYYNTTSDTGYVEALSAVFLIIGTKKLKFLIISTKPKV